MTLSHPQSTFVNVLGSLGIVPPAVMMKNVRPRTDRRHLYRLVSFQPGQQLIVEANPGMRVKRMTLTGWFCLSG